MFIDKNDILELLPTIHVCEKGIANIILKKKHDPRTLYFDVVFHC